MRAAALAAETGDDAVVPPDIEARRGAWARVTVGRCRHSALRTV
jgi:hypothetical protein